MPRFVLKPSGRKTSRTDTELSVTVKPSTVLPSTAPFDGILYFGFQSPSVIKRLLDAVMNLSRSGHPSRLTLTYLRVKH